MSEAILTVQAKSGNQEISIRSTPDSFYHWKEHGGIVELVGFHKEHFQEAREFLRQPSKKFNLFSN